MTRFVTGLSLVLLTIVFAGGAHAGDSAEEFQEKLAEVRRSEAEQHCKLGEKLYKAGAFNEAVNEFTRAVQLTGEYPDAEKYLESLEDAG